MLAALALGAALLAPDMEPAQGQSGGQPGELRAMLPGVWAMAEPNGCVNGDTVRFYANGTMIALDNQDDVLSVGVWKVQADELHVSVAMFDDFTEVDVAVLRVRPLKADTIELTMIAGDGVGEVETFHRCPEPPAPQPPA